MLQDWGERDELATEAIQAYFERRQEPPRTMSSAFLACVAAALTVIVWVAC